MAKVKEAPAESVPSGHITYRWADGRRYNVEANVAAETVEQLNARDGGCTPQALVDIARDEDHPLHDLFEWDDTEAAESWRKHQARQVINSIELVINRPEGPERRVAYLNVTVQEHRRAYLPSEQVMRHPGLRQASLTEAFAALNGWKSRFQHLSELAEVFEVLDKVAAEARPKLKVKKGKGGKK